MGGAAREMGLMRGAAHKLEELDHIGDLTAAMSHCAPPSAHQQQKPLCHACTHSPHVHSPLLEGYISLAPLLVGNTLLIAFQRFPVRMWLEHRHIEIFLQTHR